MTYTFSDYNIVSEKNGVAYVANTLSGALIRLDEPSYQAVQSQNLAQLSEKDRDFLADNGVLVEDTMDEKRMLRAAYTAFSRGRTSVTVNATLPVPIALNRARPVLCPARRRRMCWTT